MKYAHHATTTAYRKSVVSYIEAHLLWSSSQRFVFLFSFYSGTCGHEERTNQFKNLFS